jgi:rod shape-determining protein MreB
MAFRDYFSLPIYVRISINRITIDVLHDPVRQFEENSDTPFTTTRLLVGDFKSAEKTLSSGVSKVVGGALIKKSVRMVMHPVAMVEEGLSEVEKRVFNELALSAGAHSVVLHQGDVLLKDEALKLLDGKSG